MAIFHSSTDFYFSEKEDSPALMNWLFPLIILMSVFFLAACSSGNSNSGRSADNKTHYSLVLTNKGVLIIDLDTIEKRMGYYSEFFSSVRYVPLETRPESLIGRIEHIELYNDTLFVFDKAKAKAIFLFDLSGKFIRKIGKIGRGPEEWVSPVSFSINKRDRELMVLDGSFQKIFRFSFSGRFLGQITLQGSDIRSHTIECDNGQIYLDAVDMSKDKSGPGYLLREIDSDGKTIKYWFDAQQYNKGWDQAKNPYYFSGSGTLYSSPSGIKYADMFMDTVYSINSNGISPFIALKTKFQFSAGKIEEISRQSKDMLSLMNTLGNEKGIWAIQSYVENDDIVRFVFKMGDGYNEVIINKKTMAPVCLKAFFNDFTYIGKAGQYFPQIYCGDKKLIIGLLEGRGLLDLQKSVMTSKTKISDTEKEKILSIEPTGNPIILILQTK
jgi:hypothetical protein